MGWKPWKSLEKAAAKLLGGQRRVRVSYAESVEDVLHPRYGIECKYGKQVPGYCKVKEVTRLNDDYLLVPSDCFGKRNGKWEEKTVGYDLEFLQKGMAQAQSYDSEKIPVLCLKPQRWSGFVLCFWYADYVNEYLSFFKELNRIKNGRG